MELDIEDFDALRKYLALQVLGQEPALIKTLPGGISNRTVQVTWNDGRAWVLKQALERLRVKEDWFSSPERTHVEARALRWLNRLAPPGMTPTILFEDVPNHLLAMEAVPEGHENWKAMLLSGRISPEHFEHFGALLGIIHRKSSEAGAELSRAFADTGYFESLRLDPYYGNTARKVASAAGFLTTLSRETLRHKLSLVHGDFSPKNVLVYQDKLILLDYEVVHFGDPAFDLGFFLTHLVLKSIWAGKRGAEYLGLATDFWRTYRATVASTAGADELASLEERMVWNLAGCLLARVDGKSPVEYLSAERQRVVREVARRWVASPSLTWDDAVPTVLTTEY